MIKPEFADSVGCSPGRTECSFHVETAQATGYDGKSLELLVTFENQCQEVTGVFTMRLILGVVMILTFTACEDNSAPETKITTVDGLLTRACELAADCGGATQEEIDACPADLLQNLDADDVAELERFLTFDRAEQDRILECFDGAICDRFGGSLSSISDSDLMEPLRDCE